MATKKTAKKAAKKAAKKTAKTQAEKSIKECSDVVDDYRGSIPPKHEEMLFNEYGLRNGTSYIFNEDGFVDWKSMIGKEHFVVNDSWFIERGKDIPTKVTEDLTDEQLIIKLSGYRSLSKLRGFKSLKMSVEESNAEYACVKCVMVSRGNYETGFEDVVFEAVANATRSNVDDFMSLFLETIAANRALCRCVRNFLNIDIVSSDELSYGKQRKDLEMENAESLAQDSQTSKSGHVTPQQALKRSHEKAFKSGDFNDLIEFLRKAYVDGKFKDNTDQDSVSELKGWTDWDSVPVNECIEIMGLIKEETK